ncbi:tripartite motif-containing protein 16-like isoform X3 [Cyprinus carpio]|uniref:Tripartite motif-containing protein 16-like isoform X3 n=1 Tax=Cyprinus carpio TaxID=7962 RepID=A0A9R0BGV4_CYPCA|nr:tripartite motif-containing protein 16-like isoform X3 [Cyprinus carpio]
MANASTSWSWEEFNCPICLDLLKNPVALTCGHSYCMSCITDCWDQDDQKGVCSCPQCRQIFTPRPVLGKNTMLAEVLEKLKKIKLQAARPAQCSTGSGDVECDICTGDKNKAVKSCLVCLESYCQKHLERHEEFHSGKRHKMTDATGQLRDMICPLHDKLLEIFCRTDQQCICYLCMLDEHKNHETVSATAERTEKQRQLGEMQRKYQERIQKREKELEELKEAVESYKHSAQAAVEDSERIFTELIRSIKRSRSEVTQLIRDQENAAVRRAEGQLEQLEQEIEDLRRRDAELEQLSHTDNHICFFQSFQSLSVPPGSTDSPSITVSSRLSFDDVGKSVSHLRDKLENFCREEIEKISCRVTYIVVIPTSEPKTREDFLQYSRQLNVDLNTVNKLLCLSKGNRVITYTNKGQPYPDHPDRFDHWSQVLCRESACGRCYWEVEWKGRVDISVSYKSINRKGWSDESEFGCNDQSWSWLCSDSRCSFWHNNGRTALPVVSSSSRIGVYVDQSAGTLYFYSVSDTMTLIHRVQTTFTQPLYAGFNFHSLSVFFSRSESKVKLCDLKI